MEKTAMLIIMDMFQVQNPLRNQMLELEKNQVIEAYDYSATQTTQTGLEYYTSKFNK